MNDIERVQETNVESQHLSWWTRQLGPDTGRLCWETHHGYSKSPPGWIRELVNETLTSATWCGGWVMALEKFPTPTEGHIDAMRRNEERLKLKQRIADLEREAQSYRNTMVGMSERIDADIARARAEERERCAKECETMTFARDVDWWLERSKKCVSKVTAQECAKAIRALGDE